jgi:two-component system chemotaxis response regulator CheY
VDKVEKLFQAMNVLVVDDMDAIRNLVNTCLKELGVHTVILAPNGSVAWNQIQNTGIDLIVCDWDMPQVSGLELLKLIRGAEQYRHIPFLMLTGITEKEKVINAVEAGVNDFLSKPFSPKDLEYRIIKLLRKVKLS